MQKNFHRDDKKNTSMHCCLAYPFFIPATWRPCMSTSISFSLVEKNILIKLSVDQYWNINPLKSCIEKDWQNKVQHGQLSPIHVTVHIIFIGGQKSERAISGEINEYRTRCVSFAMYTRLNESSDQLIFIVNSPKFF